MNHRQLAESTTILRAPNGSRLHGVYLDGQDDRDEMAVFIPPPELVCGVDSLDHVIARDAAEGERSKPGDLDLTMYSLRKFVALALKGNPSIAQMFWVPREMMIELGPSGEELLEMRPHLVAQNALKAYHGYLTAQYHGLKGSTGTKVKRPELVAAHGYDTKYAFHAVRLGLQGLWLGEFGEIKQPVTGSDRVILLSIRLGELSLEAVTGLIEHQLAALGNMIHDYRGPLPIQPNRDLANKWLASVHLRWWKEQA